jgi:hypothetical protein
MPRKKKASTPKIAGELEQPRPRYWIAAAPTMDVIAWTAALELLASTTNNPKPFN